MSFLTFFIGILAGAISGRLEQRKKDLELMEEVSRRVHADRDKWEVLSLEWAARNSVCNDIEGAVQDLKKQRHQFTFDPCIPADETGRLEGTHYLTRRNA